MENGGKNTILIVEDESDLADIYATKFTIDGYQVLLAGDGDAGLEMARDKHPDLILLDVILPKKNGYDTLQALKADRRTRDIPVVILSNMGQAYEVKHGLKLGADKYLIKTDYTPAEVVREVRATLDEKVKGADAKS